MKSALSVIIGLGSILFAGCTSLRYASQAEEAAAKRFSPSEGKAVVYVYREEDKNPDYVPLEFCRNFKANSGKERTIEPAGWLFSKTFMRWELEPGVHQIIIFYPNHVGTSTHETTLAVSANEIYFFKVTPEPEVVRAIELEGKLAVQHCRLLRNELRR